MNDFNGNLPILGQDTVKPRVAPGPPVAFVRRLDENGTFEPESVHAVNAQQNNIVIGRANLCSAEDLVDMLRDELREVVREELRRYLDKVVITAGLGQVQPTPGNIRLLRDQETLKGPQ